MINSVAFFCGALFRSRTLLCGALVVMLTGCGDNRGCFGLCDARDDDDDDDAEVVIDPTADLSCYPASGLSARAAEAYVADGLGTQVLRFFDSAAASATVNRPVLVWITGDSWATNIGVTDAPQKAQDIATRLGAHFATVSYRSSNEAGWPAQIQDVKAALRFLRAQNATNEYRIDTNQIYIGGDQAGAHLAALTATTNGVMDFEPATDIDQPDTINLLITLGGAFDLETLPTDNSELETLCQDSEFTPRLNATEIRNLFDCTTPESGEDALSTCDAEAVRLAGPAQSLGTEDPLVLMYHGALDCQVPSAQTEQYNELYTESSILNGRQIFTLLANDDASLDSLTAQAVLEDLVTSPSFDCDDET